MGDHDLDLLPPRYVLILRRRFLDRHSLEKIGKELGISRERVRQLESDALARLRIAGVLPAEYKGATPKARCEEIAEQIRTLFGD